LNPTACDMHTLPWLVCSGPLFQAIQRSCCSHIATAMQVIRGIVITLVPLWLKRLTFLLL